MSIVSVANETGMHINTISKYFKAVRDAGTHMPDDHAKQLDIIRDVIAKSQQTGMTALEYIAQNYGKNSPAAATTGNKSAAHTAATAAAIEEQLAIVSRKLQTLMTNMEVDREETNEMLAAFQARTDEAEKTAELALSVARAALDIITRQTSTSELEKHIDTRFSSLVRTIELAVIHATGTLPTSETAEIMEANRRYFQIDKDKDDYYEREETRTAAAAKKAGKSSEIPGTEESENL